MALSDDIARHRPARPLVAAIAVLVLSLACSATLIWRLEQRRFELEQALASDMAGDHAHLLQAGIERVISATFSLAALIREGKGNISNFEATAREMLPFFPGAASLQLAPGGVVRQIVPLAGNEAAIGHDLFNDPQRRNEAIKARDDGKLTLAGPFILKQGGLGAVGRMPTYLDNGAGGRSFWGFTNVLIRFPEALAPARLENMEKRGFRYELWRLHPDTGERQIIAASSSTPLISPVDRSLELPNGTWTLSVAPSAGWSDSGGLALKSTLGLLVSLLLAFLTHSLLNIRAKALQIAQELTSELRESERGLSEAQRIAHLGSWELDLESNVLTWSDEIFRIFEIDPEQFDASYEAFLNTIHPDDRDLVNRAYTDSVKSKLPYDIVHRLRMPDGRVKYVNEKCETYYAADGKPLRSVGTVHDITERKRVEDEVRELNQKLEQRVVERTAQLQAANKELEAFAYSVSHDLRAPLRHIDGYVDMLVSHCRDGLSDKGLHYVETIAASARQMGVLIEELLQFSRTGRAELRRESFDMNQALREALSPIKESCAQRGIEWVIGNLPPVRGDAALLRQVWANLLENAVKFTRTRKDARIEVSAREENGETVFHVADNGVGFDMHYVDKLFGVFQRLHSQEEFEGTGIGLATVQRIVARHGGRVRAEGTVGGGATFYFTLPRVEENYDA